MIFFNNKNQTLSNYIILEKNSVFGMKQMLLNRLYLFNIIIFYNKKNEKSYLQLKNFFKRETR